LNETAPGETSILGLMSGTSLDGLDMALCEFEPAENGFDFKIIKARTTAYSDTWKERLSSLKNATAERYFGMNALYGKYTGDEINAFLKGTDQRPSAVASHGHTVFHQPAAGFSTQVGCGATIAAVTGITTVCDFRSMDVALQGQGAPLVPIGDQLLFGQYEACLNIGGIANISFDDKSGRRIAYDACIANMLLNHLAGKTGAAFDRGGEMARSGKTDLALLNALNGLEYHARKGAKSIGRELFESTVLKLVDNSTLGVTDLLATATAYSAHIIAKELNDNNIKNVLVTGGGAFNTFLIENIKARTGCEIIIPSGDIVNFKEALIFAFLGYLRLNKQINTLSSVTGALRDSIGGAVYIGT